MKSSAERKCNTSNAERYRTVESIKREGNNYVSPTRFLSSLSIQFRLVEKMRRLYTFFFLFLKLYTLFFKEKTVLLSTNKIFLIQQFLFNVLGPRNQNFIGIWCNDKFDLPRLQLSCASSHRETTLIIARPANCTQTAIATFLSPCSWEISSISSPLYAGGLISSASTMYYYVKRERSCEV